MVLAAHWRLPPPVKMLARRTFKSRARLPARWRQGFLRRTTDGRSCQTTDPDGVGTGRQAQRTQQAGLSRGRCLAPDQEPAYGHAVYQIPPALASPWGVILTLPQNGFNRLSLTVHTRAPKTGAGCRTTCSRPDRLAAPSGVFAILFSLRSLELYLSQILIRTSAGCGASFDLQT